MLLLHQKPEPVIENPDPEPTEEGPASQHCFNGYLGTTFPFFLKNISIINLINVQ